MALQIKLMLFFETDLHLAGGFYAGEETAKTLATVIVHTVIQWIRGKCSRFFLTQSGFLHSTNLAWNSMATKNGTGKKYAHINFPSSNNTWRERLLGASGCPKSSPRNKAQKFFHPPVVKGCSSSKSLSSERSFYILTNASWQMFLGLQRNTLSISQLRCRLVWCDAPRQTHLAQHVASFWPPDR